MSIMKGIRYSNKKLKSIMMKDVTKIIMRIVTVFRLKTSSIMMISNSMKMTSICKNTMSLWRNKCKKANSILLEKRVRMSNRRKSIIMRFVMIANRFTTGMPRMMSLRASLKWDTTLITSQKTSSLLEGIVTNMIFLSKMVKRSSFLMILIWSIETIKESWKSIFIVIRGLLMSVSCLID
jgi:hypothetical protein